MKKSNKETETKWQKLLAIAEYLSLKNQKPLH